MKWMQRVQVQKSKMIQPKVTGIPIQRKLPGALPANDVRVRYQPTPASQIHTGGGVIQCCGKLRSFLCCCCDDVPVTGQQQQPQVPMGRMDGACAVFALKGLKWEPDYNKDTMNRIQNPTFATYGMPMANGFKLSELNGEQVLVEFFNGILPYAFHVMYTKDGQLHGKNNDTTMLNMLLGSPIGPDQDPQKIITKADSVSGEFSFIINSLTVHDHKNISVKYVTKDQYMDYLATLNQTP